MKHTIKNSFDQIHAPKELIQETKRMIHDTEQIQKRKKENTIRKTTIGILATAASLAVLLVGTNVFKEKNTSSQPLGQSGVNVANQDTTDEFKVERTKTEAEWKEYLQQIDTETNQEIALTDAYTVCLIPFVKEGMDYHIEIQLKEGILLIQNQEERVTGEFYCVIYEGSRIIEEEKLSQLTSKQFTKQPMEPIVEAKVEEETVTFVLENVLENGETEQIAFQLDSEWKITQTIMN
ncbi:hypothetical protein [Anaerosporobacter faecicola]|uniref:hypothetical protein n=1 Tax=Anaerosporobacter faecicola TaxID=2718714 RepID=UPI00143C5B5D|nr:hypothetical protein [Anaerosporobacter faecicola]